MKNIMLFPEGGHTPGDPFFRVRQCTVENPADILQFFLLVCILTQNVLVNGFRFFATVMTLFLFLKFPSAFGAFPHSRFFAVSFLQNHFVNIAKALAKLSADLSGNADDVIGRYPASIVPFCSIVARKVNLFFILCSCPLQRFLLSWYSTYYMAFIK